MARPSLLRLLRLLPAPLAFGMALLAPAVAHAGELEDLEKTLDAELSSVASTLTLSTSDCARACQALSSIRRAADRICALEPGPRCLAAQTKALDAGRRVREACPQCSAAALTPGGAHEPGSMPVTPAPAPLAKKAAPESAERDVEVAKAGGNRTAGSAPGKGGCASCDAGGVAPGDGVAGLLGVLAMARLLRARSRSRARR